MSHHTLLFQPVCFFGTVWSFKGAAKDTGRMVYEDL
jgi:hypothetical protein